MDELTTFAVAQDNQSADVDVFGVDTSTNFGMNFVDTSIKVIKNINVENYSRYNITRVIVEVLQKLCYEQYDRECKQFTIYSSEKFYSVLPYSRNMDKLMKMMQNAKMIYSWTNYSRDSKADTTATYRIAAKLHCPKIYEYAGNQF